MSRHLKTQKPSLDFENRVIKNARFLNCRVEEGPDDPDLRDAVRFTPQTLSAGQKAQALTNIGAAAQAALQEAVAALETAVAAKYTKPVGGIPATDMDADVQSALAKANSAIQSLAGYYTSAQVDQLLEAINSQEYVDVSSLPTASSETLSKIYLVGPDSDGYYDIYYTSYDGTDYSWVGPLGTTKIVLANYATKEELSQLDQKVNGGTPEIYSNSTKYSSITWISNPIPGGKNCIAEMPESSAVWHRLKFAKDSSGTDAITVVENASGSTVTRTFVSPDPTVYTHMGIQKNNTLTLKIYEVVTGIDAKVTTLEAGVAANKANCIVSLPFGTWTDDKGVLSYDGTLSGNESYAATDFVDVRQLVGCVLDYKRVATTFGTFYLGMAFYTEEKVYLSGVLPLTSQSNGAMVPDTVEVPTGAAYARFSCIKAKKAEFSVSCSKTQNNIKDGARNTTLTAVKKTSLSSPFQVIAGLDSEYRFRERVVPGMLASFGAPSTYSVRIQYYDAKGNPVWNAGKYSNATNAARAPYGAVVVDVLIEKLDETAIIGAQYTTKQEAINAALTAIEMECLVEADAAISASPLTETHDKARRLRRIVSVAHQGYAGSSGTYGYSHAGGYERAAEFGFDAGECDVQWSSDNVPVCCHDASFTDSTSGDTIVIAEHTVEELKTYDYEDGTIATLEEIVSECKRSGLFIVIDKLTSSLSDAKLATVFGLLQIYGMADKSAIVVAANDSTLAEKVFAWNPKATIHITSTSALSASLVSTANALQTDINKVILSLSYQNVTEAAIREYMPAAKAGVELYVWTVNTKGNYESFLPFVNGITSDVICEGMVK